jgi:hypothetical protein
MEPAIFYHKQIEGLTARRSVLLKNKTVLGWLRFAAMGAVAAVIYFLWAVNMLVAIGAALLCVVAFIRILFADIKNNAAIQHTQHLITINEDELKALAHNYTHFKDGHEYIPHTHAYCNDLDILGKASLFQYCNRTTSEMGGNTLAGWLLEPAAINVILQRQEAVKELTEKTMWRQQLQAYGMQAQISAATQQRLQQWLQSPPLFINNNIWKLLQYAIPAIIIGIILLNIGNVITDFIRNIFLAASAVVAFAVAKKIMPLHQQVSKITDELAILSHSIQLIESTTFNCPLLQQLQTAFKTNRHTPSSEARALKKIVERLDLRLNPVVFIPLAIILQWDIQQAMALEKWQQRNRQSIDLWFDALAQFEALHSFAGLQFNHPQWCIPAFTDAHFTMLASNLGHPLLAAQQCITNNITVTPKEHVLLITGSNMAGKSTYLRSVGVNTVLAMAGAAVCATSFTLSPVQVISSMRIADNLEESTSTFYAELKKLKSIIEKVNTGEKIFILLDEILRGTNSLDRHTGSAALIKQLIHHKAACIIATHDVALASLQQQYPNAMMNYHFDVQVANEELFFDYKLKEGVCTSLNASILMRKIGIEL